MKKHLFSVSLICSLILPLINSAQEFSWEKGSKSHGNPGSYGTINVPSMSNNPYPRSEFASWKDADGNLWIFGGDRTIYSQTAVMNDLLKYDLATREWTWKKGLAYTSNAQGIYGQQGIAASQNNPGARRNAATWTDQSGNLWMFGGYGFAATGGGYLNDLWKYDPLTNMWIWVKGSHQFSQYPTNGTKGAPDPLNTPGGRDGSISWIDKNGDLWLYGGYGIATNGNLYHLCDLWRYNILTNEWTWMSGNSSGSFGVYTNTSIDRPGGRRDAGCWADTSGNLWLFGGYGYTDQYDGGYRYLNDIWKYNISSDLWTWVKGSDQSDRVSVYGLKGFPSPTNTPGGRYGFGYASDADGFFWIFGGRRTDGNALAETVGELWKYNPQDNKWTWVAGDKQPSSYGVYGVMTVPDPANYPGSRVGLEGWSDNSGNIWFFGGYGVATFTSSGYDYLNDLWKFGNCVDAGFQITSSKNVLCEGESASLSTNIPGSVTWSTAENTSTIVVTPSVNTNYVATLFDNYGCTLTANYTATVVTCTDIDGGQSSNPLMSIYPNPTDGLVNVKLSQAGAHTLTLFNSTGALVYSEKLRNGINTVNLNLAAGLYYYVVDHETKSKGKLIVR